MEQEWTQQRPSADEAEEIARLKCQYESVENRILYKWMQAVKGTHREAMAEVLRDRGFSVSQR